MSATDTRPLLEVAAGIVFNENSEFLLSSRPAGKPYAGYWEFAGGKVEAGESAADALKREFAEELGIDIRRALPWLVKIHSYEHARVRLHFFRVPADGWAGGIQAKEGQSWAWQKAGDFTVSPMLPANGALLKALSVPTALTGRLKDGFYGANAAGTYRAVPPTRAAADDKNLLLTAAEYLLDGRPSAAESLWLAVDNPAGFARLQDEADVIVWRVGTHADAQTVLDTLHAGTSVPLVVSTDADTAAQYGADWLAAGAQAVAAEEQP
jgi:hydrolase, NUDIX family